MKTFRVLFPNGDIADIQAHHFRTAGRTTYFLDSEDKTIARLGDIYNVSRRSEYFEKSLYHNPEVLKGIGQELGVAANDSPE